MNTKSCGGRTSTLLCAAGLSLIAGCDLTPATADLGIYHAVEDPADARNSEPEPSSDAAPDLEPDASIDAAPESALDGAVVVPPQLAEDAGLVAQPSADAGFRGGSGGAWDQPISYDDPELHCYTLRAHATNDHGAPYAVPAAFEGYVDFVLTPPWQGTRYVRSLRPVVGNTHVLHHVTAFSNATMLPESIGPSDGRHDDAALLYAWVPGGHALYLDPDVGLEVRGDSSYTLELHYYNALGEVAEDDASGIELCVTTVKPTYVVSSSRLGAADAKAAPQTCRPDSAEPIHIVAAQASMGVESTRVRVELELPDGSLKTLLDEPYSGARESLGPLAAQLPPGGAIRTTCSYAESARPWAGVSDEPCFFHALHWPAHTLVSPTGGSGSLDICN